MSSTATKPAPLHLETASEVLCNLPIAELVQHAVRDGDVLAGNGALVAYTGKYTGRTPKDKFVVREPSSEANIWWENNAEMSQETFSKLMAKANEYIRGKRLYCIDTFGGADPDHRIKARFLVERPYHAMFIKQLLISPTQDELESYEPEWTIVDLCHLTADPQQDGTRS